MQKDCFNCQYSVKEVTEDPCFSCLDTPYKKNFIPMDFSKSELSQSIREKRILYEIFSQVIESRKGNIFAKDIDNLIKAKEDYTKEVMEALCSKKCILMEVYDGDRLRRI